MPLSMKTGQPECSPLFSYSLAIPVSDVIGGGEIANNASMNLPVAFFIDSGAIPNGRATAPNSKLKVEL